MLLSCHVRVSEWIHNCLNVKELLAWSRCEIWSLSDGNWTRTQNHLALKWTLNHLTELANVWVFVQELNGSGFKSKCSHLSCLLRVSVGTFWVDCKDSVCVFLSIGIADWIKISERSYWEFSSTIFEWFDYVIYGSLSGIIIFSFCFVKRNLIRGPSFH